MNKKPREYFIQRNNDAYGNCMMIFQIRFQILFRFTLFVAIQQFQVAIILIHSFFFIVAFVTDFWNKSLWIF